MPDHILERAKGYIALVGAVCTALLGLYGPDTQVGHWLTVASALATAVLTYRIPNKPTKK